jgi:tryptophanase
MATKTWQERFDEVQDAISHIVTSGQSVTYNGRAMTMANLAELRKLADYYESKITAEGSKVRRSRVSYIIPQV